jgi:hypothetical protein
LRKRGRNNNHLSNRSLKPITEYTVLVLATCLFRIILSSAGAGFKFASHFSDSNDESWRIVHAHQEIPALVSLPDDHPAVQVLCKLEPRSKYNFVHLRFVSRPQWNSERCGPTISKLPHESMRPRVPRSAWGEPSSKLFLFCFACPLLV